MREVLYHFLNDSSTTEKNISLNNLEISYARVNFYFIIVAFISAILVICGDGLVYYKNNYTFLVFINATLFVLIVCDIFLVFTKKIKVRTGFIIYLYTVLLNITLTHLNEYGNRNFTSSVILIGFWGLLLMVIAGLALGKWHPYVVVLWSGSMLLSDIIRTKNPFLIDTLPVVFVALVGITYGVNIYMNVLRSSFQKNQDAFVEISNQKSKIEDQARELEQKNNHLSELQTIQRDMIDMLAHDMKNPLNSILINTSSKSLSLYEKKSVHEAGRQMLLLVENMLDVHKMESIKPRLLITNINLEESINEAFELVNFLVYQRSQSFDIHVDSTQFVKADREILIRVLVNLFTNAIKHSPENSVISISSGNESNDFVTIQVKDHGEGIPENYKEKIFDKYVQAVSRKSGSARSTGLGLTFCKMSIELMDGKIRILDSSNTGTIISFNLPKAQSGVHSLQRQNIKNEINFLTEDIDLLKPVALEMKKLELYKAGLIFNALTKVQPVNKRVEQWIEDIKNAVYSSNHEKYMELLEMVN